MYYLYKCLYIYTCGQSGCRWYCSIIAGAPRDTDWEILEMQLEAVSMRTWEMYFEAAIEQVSRCICKAKTELDSAMHLEAVKEGVWRCTWRPRWSNSEIHLGAEFELNTVIHSDAVIKRIWRCIWRPRSCNSEMHLEAEIGRLGRCTWRPWSIEIGGVNRGDRSGGGSSGGRCNGFWDSIYWLSCNHDNVKSWVQ